MEDRLSAFGRSLQQPSPQQQTTVSNAIQSSLTRLFTRTPDRDEIDCLCKRDPKKRVFKQLYKASQIEHPSKKRKVEKNAQASVEKVKETSSHDKTSSGCSEQVATIKIMGEQEIEMHIFEENKTALCSLSTMFTYLLSSSEVKSDGLPIELGNQRASQKALHHLLQLAISNKDIESGLTFDQLQSLYNAAYELQIPKYTHQAKKLCLEICVTSKKAEKLKQFKIICEEMQEHSREELEKLYTIGLNYPHLSKLLMLKASTHLSSDMNFMLEFMDNNREQHPIEFYSKEIIFRSDYNENHTFLTHIDYWLPNLKSFEIAIEDERSDMERGIEEIDQVELIDLINFKIGFFSRLRELKITGLNVAAFYRTYEASNIFYTIEEYCSKLEKLTVDVEIDSDLLARFESLKNLTEIHVDIDEDGKNPCNIHYVRQKSDEPFVKRS